MLSTQAGPMLCYWTDHIWSTWDHWQHICCWRYEARKTAYIIMQVCLFLYTTGLIIEDEIAEALRLAIIQTCIGLRPMVGPFVVVRTDPAPWFQAFVTDQILESHRISIELGRFKNANKNPVAEHAVQEVWEHILKTEPTARPVSSLLLSLTVASVNSSIRQGGLSAKEMLTQRDQFTNRQLPVRELTETPDSQYQSRLQWEI